MNNGSKRVRRAVLQAIAALCLSSGLLAGCASLQTGQTDSAVLHLVRHAEKLPGRDPALTPAGETRAEDLVVALAEAPIEVIYSTNYRRTRLTARPSAQARDLPVIYYDPSDLAGFAAKLKSENRSALIVGHSNTTPELVAALGGEPGAPITEATEYDRLYRIELTDDRPLSAILRYGTPTER